MFVSSALWGVWSGEHAVDRCQRGAGRCLSVPHGVEAVAHPPVLTPCPAAAARCCSLALLGFLVMHGRLIATNMTTIEAYEKKPVK